ncbi:hypothetical protein O7607_09060 [Micromonospora sp. WMMA1949]|uniref:hypothetical protein n=1 Tax=Micromonospora sp. WMMA1949 TaxID=3015162 RepID=UPI0022B5E86D|nr:hypothetical protein [Micromonospora sp. WMMA1949]MCZ7425880.1 hypothetical protein [Micromonospora sp. WMMA1949]
MDEFWSGATSALIGAIVGGVASWLAASVQVKGAMRVAKMQVQDSLEAQRVLRREELEREALIAYYQLGDKQHDALYELAKLHAHEPLSDGSCPDVIRLSGMKELIDESDRVKRAHRAFLPAEPARELEYVEDVLWDTTCERPRFNEAVMGESDGTRCPWALALHGAMERLDYATVCIGNQLEGRAYPAKRF